MRYEKLEKGQHHITTAFNKASDADAIVITFYIGPEKQEVYASKQSLGYRLLIVAGCTSNRGLRGFEKMHTYDSVY